MGAQQSGFVLRQHRFLDFLKDKACEKDLVCNLIIDTKKRYCSDNPRENLLVAARTGQGRRVESSLAEPIIIVIWKM